MKILAASIAIALTVNATTLAQKPQKPQPQPPQEPRLTTMALAQALRIEFENDWVRVTRMHYDAHGEVPVHDHPAGTTVYLYLNASDGVLFLHTDKSEPYHRPPVLPGAIRIASTVAEHHSVVNNADTPSDSLRVFLKTEYFGNLARPNTRMAPDRMDYDHRSVHVARINVQPGTKTRLEAKNYPMFRIALIPDKTEWRVSSQEGYRFLDKGTTEEFEVSGNVPMQLLTIELKTPIAKPK